MAEETPNEIYGRLKEAVHFTGYGLERVIKEFEWLLESERWMHVGPGFDDIDAFVATLHLNEFKISVEQRKTIAGKLQELGATQRATAKALGVHQTTILHDLRSDENSSNKDLNSPKINKEKNVSDENSSNTTPFAQSGTRAARSAIARDETIIRRQRRIEEVRNTPLEGSGYRVIYADPPWQYSNNLPVEMSAPTDYYPTMPLEEIATLPVKGIVTKDAVLFLWVTSPILPEAFTVISAWGFTYKSSFVWDKVKPNMGHYNSIRHEFLLICTKGSCQPDVNKHFDSVASIPRSNIHSQKPQYFREIIDTIYPYGKRIELFARERFAGWDVWGNQLQEALDDECQPES